MRKGLAKIYGMGILMMLLTACGTQTEYTNALPKGASLVVSADLMSMAGKSGWNGESTQTWEKKMGEILQGGLSEEASAMARDLIRNPKESGLSFAHKIYLFATPHANAYGWLAKVESERKVKKVIETLKEEGLCTTLKEESGCMWTQMGNWICAFNNGTFVMMKNARGDAANIQGTLMSLMRQEEGEGYAARPEFERMSQCKGDVVLVADLSLVPDRMSRSLRMGLPGDIGMQDVQYLIDIHCMPGKVDIHAEALTQNPKVKEFYQTLNGMTGKTQRKFMNHYPANTMLWAGTNVKGAELYKLLHRNPIIRQKLENPELPVDMERIFQAIRNGVTIGMPSLVNGGWIAYAQVENDTFLQTFEDLRPLLAMTGGQVRMYDTADKQYAIQTYNAIYWFGVKDGVMYVTNRKKMAEEAGRTYGVSIENRPWAKEAYEDRWAASFNVNTLAEECKNNRFLLPSWIKNKETAAIAQKAIKGLDTVNITLEDWDKCEMEIILKNKNINLLQWLVKELNEL